VHPDNQLLGFLAYSAVDAMRAIELSRGEFLLVFQTLGIYVDAQGRKSRDREIMYPAIPQAVSKLLEFNLQALLISVLGKLYGLKYLWNVYHQTK
jgi:hypothetical protein